MLRSHVSVQVLTVAKSLATGAGMVSRHTSTAIRSSRRGDMQYSRKNMVDDSSGDLLD